MTKQTSAFGRELDSLVRRFSPTVSNDEIAGVLISRAMLIHLRTTNTDEAVRRMRFSVDALEQVWAVGKEATG